MKLIAKKEKIETDSGDSYVYDFDVFKINDDEMKCDKNVESKFIFPVKRDHEKACMADTEIFILDFHTNGDYDKSFPNKKTKRQFHIHVEWFLSTISEDLTLVNVSPGSIVLDVEGPEDDLRKTENILGHGNFLTGSKKKFPLGDFFRHAFGVNVKNEIYQKDEISEFFRNPLPKINLDQDETQDTERKLAKQNQNEREYTRSYLPGYYLMTEFEGQYPTTELTQHKHGEWLDKLTHFSAGETVEFNEIALSEHNIIKGKIRGRFQITSIWLDIVDITSGHVSMEQIEWGPGKYVVIQKEGKYDVNTILEIEDFQYSTDKSLIQGKVKGSGMWVPMRTLVEQKKDITVNLLADLTEREGALGKASMKDEDIYMVGPLGKNWVQKFVTVELNETLTMKVGDSGIIEGFKTDYFGKSEERLKGDDLAFHNNKLFKRLGDAGIVPDCRIIKINNKAFDKDTLDALEQNTPPRTESYTLNMICKSSVVFTEGARYIKLHSTHIQAVYLYPYAEVLARKFEKGGDDMQKMVFGNNFFGGKKTKVDVKEGETFQIVNLRRIGIRILGEVRKYHQDTVGAEMTRDERTRGMWIVMWEDKSGETDQGGQSTAAKVDKSKLKWARNANYAVAEIGFQDIYEKNENYIVSKKTRSSKDLVALYNGVWNILKMSKVEVGTIYKPEKYIYLPMTNTVYAFIKDKWITFQTGKTTFVILKSDLDDSDANNAYNKHFYISPQKYTIIKKQAQMKEPTKFKKCEFWSRDTCVKKGEEYEITETKEIGTAICGKLKFIEDLLSVKASGWITLRDKKETYAIPQRLIEDSVEVAGWMYREEIDALGKMTEPMEKAAKILDDMSGKTQEKGVGTGTKRGFGTGDFPRTGGGGVYGTTQVIYQGGSAPTQEKARAKSKAKARSKSGGKGGGSDKGSGGGSAYQQSAAAGPSGGGAGQQGAAGAAGAAGGSGSDGGAGQKSGGGAGTGPQAAAAREEKGRPAAAREEKAKPEKKKEESKKTKKETKKKIKKKMKEAKKNVTEIEEVKPVNVTEVVEKEKEKIVPPCKSNPSTKLANDCLCGKHKINCKESFFCYDNGCFGGAKPCVPHETQDVTYACACGTAGVCKLGQFCYDNQCADSAKKPVKECVRSNSEAGLVTEDCRCSKESKIVDCTKGKFCWLDDSCNNKAKGETKKTDGCRIHTLTELTVECICAGSPCKEGKYCYDEYCNDNKKVCSTENIFEPMKEGCTINGKGCGRGNFFYDAGCYDKPRQCIHDFVKQVGRACVCANGAVCKANDFCYNHQCYSIAKECSQDSLRRTGDACMCGGYACDALQFCYENECHAERKSRKKPKVIPTVVEEILSKQAGSETISILFACIIPFMMLILWN